MKYKNALNSILTVKSEIAKTKPQENNQADTDNNTRRNSKMFKTEYEFRNFMFAQTFKYEKDVWVCLGTCKIPCANEERLFFAIVDMENMNPYTYDMLMLPMNVLDEPGTYRLSSCGNEAELTIGKMGDISMRMSDDLTTEDSDVITYSFCIPAIKTSR